MDSLKGFVWISFGLGSVLYAVLATEYDRMLIFKEPIPDKVLPGHVIETDLVPDEGSCRVKCYMEPNCVSINVGPATEGQLTCELNNHTDESTSHSSLVKRNDSIHYAVENFCHGDPCPVNVSFCQVGFTSKGYRCVCHKGYIITGDHGQCEDLNECNTTGANNCSQNADCVNKPGFFLCSCKPGYIGDGVNCTECVHYNGSCYTRFTNPVSWKKANATCEAYDAHLVKIESEDENNFIKDEVLVTREKTFNWIGLNDLDNENQFVWYDGTNLTGYTNWYKDNPNNDAGNNIEEDCASFSDTDGWVDRDCNTTMGYVCEKEAP